jgi:hypothetical protein
MLYHPHILQEQWEIRSITLFFLFSYLFPPHRGEPSSKSIFLKTLIFVGCNIAQECTNQLFEHPEQFNPSTRPGES